MRQFSVLLCLFFTPARSTCAPTLASAFSSILTHLAVLGCITPCKQENKTLITLKCAAMHTVYNTSNSREVIMPLNVLKLRDKLKDKSTRQ
jgi:hypothetical protein